MIRFAENLNKMIAAGLGGAMEAPSTEVAVGHRVRYMEASGAVASFETNIAAPIRSLRVDMQPIQAGSGDPSPDNIRPITGRDAVTVWREASYDPSADPALTIPLGQTVYGGTVDVIKGVLTVEWAMVDLGTLNWTRVIQSGQQVFASNLPDALVPASSSEATTAVCSARKTVSTNKLLTSESVCIGIGRYLSNAANLNAKLNSVSTKEDFKAAMSGIQLCYPLAAPVALTLDPAFLSTLKGDNNVWSDAGDVTLEYPYYEETEGY